jgi:iron complex outermembrane recepter protein
MTPNLFATAARARRGALVLGVALSVAAGAARAADGPPGTASPSATAAAETLPSVTVTGSYLRRTDVETPSPVEVIGAAEIEKSGKVTVADVIRSVSADNSGTLTQAFSGALAGGASGVSLRGLTLDATLVLVDGHRMAPYPLSDDGQRPFVDLSSLPLGMVDRVEVLKDGASAIYGSDAIAGVVNIILKPQFKGFETSVNLGSSYRTDGLSQRASLLYGFGDLAEGGRNVYFNLEYRHQASISQADRGSYLSNLDLRPYGGQDRRGGIVQQAYPNNGIFTEPGMVAPQLAVQSGDPNAGYFLLPGCAPANLNYSGGCTWDINKYNKIQPRTAGLNLSGRWTQNLAERWRNTLTVSYFKSQAEQYRQSDYYSTGPVTIPYTWAGATAVVVDQTDPATTQIVLPPNHPDNPFNPANPNFSAAQAYYTANGANFASYVGQPALLYAVLTDFQSQVIHFDTDVYRVVDDVAGSAAGWNLNFSIGYVRVATHETYDGFIRASLLNAALANGSYRVGVNAKLNSPALYASLAPETRSTATSELSYLSANASHDLLALPGGPLAIAVGADARTLRTSNPGEPYAPQGDIIMDGSAYAFGSQTVYAAFAELSAPVARQLELSLAGRVDRYTDFGSSFTPKLGFKWTIVPQLALRGTYARGFRAPGVAEAGNSGTGTATSNPARDPLRCPYTMKPSDCGGGFIATQSSGNPALKPEKSRSCTLGFIVEPVKRINLAVDYFDIRRDDEIVSAPLGLEVTVRGAQQTLPDGTVIPGPILYYQAPYVNAAYSQTSGVDASIHTELLLGAWGTLTAGVSATYLLRSNQTFLDPVYGNATYHYAGTVGPTVVGGAVGTPRSRGTFSLDWTQGPLSVGTAINYRGYMKGIDESSGSSDCFLQGTTNPNCYIASFTYADLYGQYHWNDHLQLDGTVTNVTNRLAPLNTATYGGFNYNPSLDQPGGVGRYFALSVRYRY